MAAISVTETKILPLSPVQQFPPHEAQAEGSNA
jgi:hypothetical protein